MASKTIITMIDDLDGGAADVTVRFTLDGVSYEIDLSTRNAAKLNKALKPYIEKARKTRPWAGTGRARQRVGAGSDEMRAWAAARDIHLADRGRIPQVVQDAYGGDPMALEMAKRRYGSKLPTSSG